MAFLVDIAVYTVPRFGATVIAFWVLFRILKALYESLFPVIFPRMMQRFMVEYNQEMDEIKRELFWDLDYLKRKLNHKLTVLEIGVGTGANFKYYPKGSSVIPVDPNGNFDQYLKTNAKDCSRVNVQKLVVAYGEDMKAIQDSSVDVVVATLVMCSVTDIEGFLKETRRVLKPQGKFYYLEHIAGTRNTWMRHLQHLVTPLWSLVAGGCMLNRDTWKHINNAGFSRVEYRKFMAPLPMKYHIIRPHLVGHAVK
ncbi:thiol S-methyltransferase TMT1A-like [Glandiceps talaboti]